MKRKSPASGKRQGLDNDFDFSDSHSSTNPTNLKTLEQLSRKWAARGYYPSPSAAMKVLMEGRHENV
jgi:hypothetical protein